jgi:hypothetical protein
MNFSLENKCTGKHLWMVVVDKKRYKFAGSEI